MAYICKQWIIKRRYKGLVFKIIVKEEDSITFKSAKKELGWEYGKLISYDETWETVYISQKVGNEERRFSLQSPSYRVRLKLNEVAKVLLEVEGDYLWV